VPAGQWVQALADIATAIGNEKGAKAPLQGKATDAAKAIAASLLSGERKAILLGNAAAHHPNASSLLALANWIGEQTGATVGYLTEAANTVGAQLVNALPGQGGLNAGQMLAGGLKAAILLNTEPEFDSAAGAKRARRWPRPRWSSRSARSRPTWNSATCCCRSRRGPKRPAPSSTPKAACRASTPWSSRWAKRVPAWKVLRVLGNMLGLPGFELRVGQEVLAAARGAADASSRWCKATCCPTAPAKAAWLGDTGAAAR
jgi:NADH-quinone oxidoreductase subunit G